MQQEYEKICKKCNEKFSYNHQDTWWNEQGMTSVKLIKCTHCGCIQAVLYDDFSMHDVNNDERYYEAGKCSRFYGFEK